ncbi:MAG: hypothetical protein ACTSPD_10120 [Promethearchaeota archaeon]
MARTKSMMVIDVGDGKEVWANTSKKVYDYAKKVLKLGDNNKVLEDVDFEFENKNGQYFVTRIHKGGVQGGEKSQEGSQEPPKSTSSLKSQEQSTGVYTPDLTEVAKALNNIAVGLVIVGLTGQVDPNNVSTLISTIKTELNK